MHKKLAITLVGWLLVVAGIILLVIPGPGLLILFAGLVVLASEYAWARRYVDPVRRRAFQAAEESVSARWRIVLTVLGGLWLFALGVLWWWNPQVPQFWIFGPRLPAGGWATGISLILSGCIVWGLLVYSLLRFGPRVRGRSRSRAR